MIGVNGEYRMHKTNKLCITLIYFLVSPGRSPLRGNLTGLARKVKDSCADWNNYDEKWTTLHKKGFSIINEIANIKLGAVYVVN